MVDHFTRNANNACEIVYFLFIDPKQVAYM